MVVPANATLGCPPPPVVEVGYGLWGGDGALVVIALSADATAGAVLRYRTEVGTVWRRVGGSTLAVEYAVVEVGRNETGAAWCVVALRYVGATSLSGMSTTISIPLGEVVGCGADTPAGSLMGAVVVRLNDAPPVSSNVAVVTDTSVAVSSVAGAVSGVGSGLINSGIAHAHVGMLRCSEFDAQSEVEFVSNPFGWAVGRAELQYQRGSLTTVAIVLCCVVVVCGTLVCVLWVRNPDGGWIGALGDARLPSSLVVPVLLLSSMALPPATSMLLYDGSSGGDRAFAVCVMVPLWGYLCLFAYRATLGVRVEFEKVEDVERCTMPRWKRALHYLMEPTYELAIPQEPCEVFPAVADADGCGHVPSRRCEDGGGEAWLRRNYFFVADRSWPAFGGAEAIVGSLVDMLEGIPLTSRSTLVCVARPAAMCGLLVFLMVLLVWRWPNAVRFQQWSALTVTGLLIVGNTLVVANAVSASPILEEAAGQVVFVVSTTIAILSLVDLLAIVGALVPSLRRSIGVTGSSLSRSLQRMKEVLKERANEEEMGALARPVLDGDDDDDNLLLDCSGGDDPHSEADPIVGTAGKRPAEISSSSPKATDGVVYLFGRGGQEVLMGMCRGLGDAEAFEAELMAMQTPAEREAEELRRFTEEVMRDL